MDNLKAMEAFAAVVRAGSYAAAAAGDGGGAEGLVLGPRCLEEPRLHDHAKPGRAAGQKCTPIHR